MEGSLTTNINILSSTAPVVVRSPNGSGRIPAEKRFPVNSESKITLFVLAHWHESWSILTCPYRYGNSQKRLAVLASCLIYARALLEYVIFIMWCVLLPKWLVVDVLLNVNFALSKGLLGLAAVLSWIAMNAVFASHWLQWNIKLLTMFINWTNWGVWMYYVKGD